MDTTFDYSGELKPEGEGRRLWDWLHAECDGIEALRPLVLELCRTADRLQEVRVKIAAQGLSVSAARGRSAKNPLLDVELKLSKQFAALWRGLGLSDKPEGERRPVGRPPEPDRL
ncbi:MAG: hypothetical protein ABSH37_13735 [Bryobacteraceae bacterium]|jgi:phage terminase small subunit